MCTVYMSGAYRCQKRMLGLLEVELWMAESHHVGAVN